MTKRRRGGDALSGRVKKSKRSEYQPLECADQLLSQQRKLIYSTYNLIGCRNVLYIVQNINPEYESGLRSLFYVTLDAHLMTLARMSKQNPRSDKMTIEQVMQIVHRGAVEKLHEPKPSKTPYPDKDFQIHAECVAKKYYKIRKKKFNNLANSIEKIRNKLIAHNTINEIDEHIEIHELIEFSFFQINCLCLIRKIFEPYMGLSHSVGVFDVSNIKRFWQVQLENFVELNSSALISKAAFPGYAPPITREQAATRIKLSKVPMNWPDFGTEIVDGS
ncbi:MAG: hypothetical protein ACRDBH_07180 [Bosea sp. (in: a-proteobacteria)]